MLVERTGIQRHSDAFVIVIVFGVSGAGKTTVGKLLATELGWHFLEADDFHSATNVEKMRSGRPLTDEDRWPWLERLREEIQRSLAAGENAVLACSALKRAYRDRLRVNEKVKFVFLRGDYALIEKQLRRRHDHFMDPGLLQSQFNALEEPQSDEQVLTIQLGRTPDETVEDIKARLHLASGD
jgi:gluconokinase